MSASSGPERWSGTSHRVNLDPSLVSVDAVTSDVVARLAGVRGEGVGGDGRVRVVVDGTGDLVELMIDPAALRLGAEGLATAVREAFGQARGKAAAGLAELADRQGGRQGIARAADPGVASLRGLEEVALAANRRLSEMSAFAGDVARRFGDGAR